MSLINQINLLAKRIATQFKGLHVVATSGSYADLKNKPTIPSIVTMKGATASAAGTAGYVPVPAAGKQTKFLRGDGTWQSVLTSVPATTVQKWATDPVTYFDSIYNK